LYKRKNILWDTVLVRKDHVNVRTAGAQDDVVVNEMGKMGARVAVPVVEIAILYHVNKYKIRKIII
jgi:hypothetical protein